MITYSYYDYLSSVDLYRLHGFDHLYILAVPVLYDNYRDSIVPDLWYCHCQLHQVLNHLVNLIGTLLCRQSHSTIKINQQTNNIRNKILALVFCFFLLRKISKLN